jgi:hypothetical protein
MPNELSSVLQKQKLYDLKLSRRLNAMKSSRAIDHVSTEVKVNVFRIIKGSYP